MDFAIRPTDKCNLNCAYCYAKKATPKPDMSLELLEKILSRLNEYCTDQSKIQISWTGGEPLLMGIDFFKRAVELEKSIEGKVFSNILQSNLTLLNEEYLDFFSETGFQIRTSLDLPPYHHDNLRIKNNFNKTMEKIELIKKRNIPININTVVTNENVNMAGEIYSFLKANKIKSFSVSRFIMQGNALDNPNLLINPDWKFGKFLNELYDLWINDYDENKIKRITPLDNFSDACRCLLEKRTDSDPSFHCQKQLLAIGPTGEIYPSCNKFFGIPKTCFGNINEVSLEQVMHSEERDLFVRTIKDNTDRVCSNCEFLPVCRGGCYYVSIASTKDGESKSHCNGYYQVFKHIYENIKGAPKK